MPKVKITNLKQGACVINSLKIIIPGGGSVLRDDGVTSDADLIELEACGIIKVTAADGVVTPQCRIQVEGKEEAKAAAKPVAAKQGAAKQGAAKKGPAPKAQTKPAPPAAKPGTSFSVQDMAGDEMGRTAVVMGLGGPEIRKMGPGINGTEAPKYVGDESVEKAAEGFTTI